MKNVLFIGLASALLLVGCNKSDPTDPNPTYKGTAQTLGNGTVYTYVAFTGDKPTAIGMTLTKGALDNLSHCAATSLVLALPADAVGKTSFDHLYLDFSHTGHEPPGIYDVAHFDVHFVMQPNAERTAIPPYAPNTAAKFDNLPPDGVMPKPYFRLPAGVPLMGVHWANPTSPELNGQKFTETLIMGSYDGKMTFIEPMITLALLQTKPAITKPVPVPTKFAKAGYFPVSYSIKQVGDDIQISLDGLTMMQ